MLLFSIVFENFNNVIFKVINIEIEKKKFIFCRW